MATLELRVIVDLEKDIQNWQEAVRATSYGVTWADKLPESISVDCVKNTDRLRQTLLEKYYSTDQLRNAAEELQKAIDPKQIADDLVNIVGKPFKENTFRIYLTTFPCAPYNLDQSYFYLIFSPVQLRNEIRGIYHELMHFLFHWHFWTTCREAGLSEAQTSDLKEAVTVMLDPIFRKRNLPEEKGYPAHQALREKIVGSVRPDETIFEGLGKLIEVVKSEG